MNTTYMVAAGAAMGAFYFVRHYIAPTTRLQRELRNVPRKTLAELPEGEAGRIVGKVAPLDDTLEAPLSGRSCLYYTAIVEVSDGNKWTEILREDRAVMCRPAYA